MGLQTPIQGKTGLGGSFPSNFQTVQKCKPGLLPTGPTVESKRRQSGPKGRSGSKLILAGVTLANSIGLRIAIPLTGVGGGTMVRRTSIIRGA